jgi:Arc/MetJ family transcription regulator
VFDAARENTVSRPTSSCNKMTGKLLIYQHLTHIESIHIKCNNIHIVRTNIEIDDQLMDEALKRSGAATKRAAVEEGLRLLIQTRRQSGIRRLRGKVRWEGDLDEMRSNKPAK